MKDNSFYDQIYACYSGIRGNVDKTVAFEMLCYFSLLKKAEMDDIEIFKKEYSIGFLSRVFGEYVIADELIEYYEEVEQWYGNGAFAFGVVSEPVAAIFRKVDSDTIKELFVGMAKIKIDDKKDLTEFYDTVLEIRNELTWKDGFATSTNKWLAMLEGKLLDARKGNTVFDYFCGTGMSVVYGCEKSNATACIMDQNITSLATAYINLVIHDCKIGRVMCGDANFAKKPMFEPIDRIVSEPPISIRHDSKYCEQVSEIRKIISKDSIEVEGIIDRLGDDGKAVVLVPVGFLFKGGKVIDFRTELVEKNLLEAVMGIPAGVIPGSMIMTALLIINKKKKDDKVIVVDSTNFWTQKSRTEYVLNHKSIKSLYDIVNERKEIKGVSKIISPEEIKGGEYNLNPGLYLATFQPAEIEVEDCSKLLDQQKQLVERLMEYETQLAKLRG